MNIRTSPLVQAVTEAKRPTDLVAWLVAVFVGVLVTEIAIQLVILILFDKAYHGSIREQVEELFPNLGTLLVLGIWVVLKEKRAFRTIGFLGDRRAWRFFCGFLGGITLFALPTAALWWGGHLVRQSSPYSMTGSTLLTVLLIIPVWIVQATTEETVIRGYLLQWHGIKQPAWAAILIISLGFALLHRNFDPLVFSQLMLFSLMCCFLVLGQGSLWMAAGVHTGWNLAQGNLFGIPVNGMSHKVSLITLIPREGVPDWLTGGDYGLEASVPAVCIELIAVVLAYLYYRRVEARREASALPLAAVP
ncbi:MAG: abortive infection protein [Chthonomonadales bacterium]|nr:abortive infection protein [Chthonomonadales bacterium]